MVNEAQAMKIIRGSKVVTIHDLARQTGVKISAANAFLRESEKKALSKRLADTAATTSIRLIPHKV